MNACQRIFIPLLFHRDPRALCALPCGVAALCAPVPAGRGADGHHRLRYRRMELRPRAGLDRAPTRVARRPPGCEVRQAGRGRGPRAPPRPQRAGACGARTALCACRVAITAVAPGVSVGPSTGLASGRDTSAAVGPSAVMTACRPGAPKAPGTATWGPMLRGI
jgi:hypothetical protein